MEVDGRRRRSDSYAVGDCRDPGMPTNQPPTQVWQIQRKIQRQMQRQIQRQRKFKYKYKYKDKDKDCRDRRMPTNAGLLQERTSISSPCHDKYFATSILRTHSVSKFAYQATSKFMKHDAIRKLYLNNTEIIFGGLLPSSFMSSALRWYM